MQGLYNPVYSAGPVQPCLAYNTGPAKPCIQCSPTQPCVYCKACTAVRKVQGLSTVLRKVHCLESTAYTAGLVYPCVFCRALTVLCKVHCQQRPAYIAGLVHPCVWCRACAALHIVQGCASLRIEDDVYSLACNARPLQPCV